MAGLSLSGLELHSQNKKFKRIQADKLWIFESIKITSIKVKGPNNPVKKKKVLQAIQVDILGNRL